MNWKPTTRNSERLRIPQAVAIRNYPSNLHFLNQHGVQTKVQPEDLSLTATAMSTSGSLPEPSHPRERRMKLSSSDSKVMSVMREPVAGFKEHHRGHTMDEVGLNKLTKSSLPPLRTKRPPYDVFLPPVVTPKGGDEGFNDALQQSKEGRFHETSISTSSSHRESLEEKTSTSSSDEDFISDDDESEGDEVPQSSLRFRDPSHSSFTSLAEVEIPELSNRFQPFVTTLMQEQFLNEHECIMTGVSESGMSSGVNNIVRAFEIKGPLDKDLLENAISNVVKIHPIFSATFHRNNSKLYVQIPQETSPINLETPLSYEKPSELITLARRKAFQISVINHKASPSSDCLNTSAHFDFDDHLSIVSCGREDSPKLPAKTTSNTLGDGIIQKLSNHSKLPTLDTTSFPPLVRAKLITTNPNEHILILSFSCVVCDYWSSCLFVQQLSHAYAQLEKAPSYRPSLAVIRTVNKRQEAVNKIESMRMKAGLKVNKATDGKMKVGVMKNGFIPFCPPRANFQQMALREGQLLLIRPKERLWTFWESVITITIKKSRGPPRIKVVPPIRIPSGFGELTRTMGIGRPTTARLRPLTARNRPVTARKRTGFGPDQLPLESLNGPKKGTHFIKISDKIGFNFLQSFPVEYSAKVPRKELLGLMSLGAYVLLLGVCSRGWGLLNDSAKTLSSEDGLRTLPSIPAPDPLLKYKQGAERLSQVLDPKGGRTRRRSESRKRIDQGSFLVGVDVSVRQLAPELTQGLFGPLSNVVGLRVDLSSNPTFADLVLSLWDGLQSARCHAHYPFSAVADELGLVQGHTVQLPVQFTYFYPHDVQQLSNPEGFHFMETTVGVMGKALARFGSSCYMNPLNTKMDDHVQLELLMWEGVRGNNIDGIFLYQCQALKPEIVHCISQEMTNLISHLSENPTASLRELSASINPPYLHARSRQRH